MMQITIKNLRTKGLNASAYAAGIMLYLPIKPKNEKNYSVKFLEKQVKIFGLSRISGVTTVII